MNTRHVILISPTGDAREREKNEKTNNRFKRTFKEAEKIVLFIRAPGNLAAPCCVALCITSTAAVPRWRNGYGEVEE